jgi:hypothetical protein
MLDGQLAKVDARNDGPEGPLTNYQIIPVVVGKDEDGEEITIGIVDPDTSKKAPPKNKPKGQPGLALDYLVEAINEVGQPPPTWLGLPPSVPRAVTVEQWKEQCQRRRLGGNEEDSRRRAFDRALDKLKELRLAETLDGYAWILYE